MNFCHWLHWEFSKHKNRVMMQTVTNNFNLHCHFGFCAEWNITLYWTVFWWWFIIPQNCVKYHHVSLNVFRLPTNANIHSNSQSCVMLLLFVFILLCGTGPWNSIVPRSQVGFICYIRVIYNMWPPRNGQWHCAIKTCRVKDRFGMDVNFVLFISSIILLIHSQIYS